MEFTQEETDYMDKAFDLKGLPFYNDSVMMAFTYGMIKSNGGHSVEGEQEQKQKLNKEKELIEFEREGKIRKQLNESDVPKRFYENINYDWTYWQGAEKAINEYNKNYLPQKKNLVITGKSYHGKSMLASTIAKRYIEKGISCFFFNVPSFFELSTAGFDDEGAKQLANQKKNFKALDCSVLILDDIFKKRTKDSGNTQSNYFETILYNIIESRLGRKPTIFTNEASMRECANQSNTALVNRILDGAFIFPPAPTITFPEWRDRKNG